MSRYFLIHSAGGAEYHYSDEDLPLTIGAGHDAHIPIAGGNEVEAYIGESRGHLFLQPATAASPSVFHNDEIVTTSVWIKSGDTIRIGNKVLTYSVSGDRIIITVVEQQAGEAPVIVPPVMPPEARPLPRFRKSDQETKPWWIGKHIWPAASVFSILVLGALFVLFAKSMEITVTPEPDAFALSGFPPPLRVGNRYLAVKSTYTYTAEKEGYEKLIKEVHLSGGGNGNQFSFTMKKLPGIINIISQPSVGVTVYFDDKQVGVSPLPEIDVPAGEHIIRLEAPRYIPLEETVLVEGFGKQQVFSFSLQPDWADVHLTSTPSGVTVTAGDTVLGTTPCTVQLSSGRNTLLFSKQKFSDFSLLLDVAAGEARTSHIELHPAPAIVTITSTPVKATVSIDGSFRGHTPLTVTVTPVEQHLVTLSAPGYSTEEKRIILTPDEEKALNVNLSPEFGTVFLAIEPPDAEVFIDGKKLALTTGRLDLPTKEQVIEVRAQGFKSEKRTIVPKKGYSQQVTVYLEKAPAAGAETTAPKFNVTPVGNALVLIQPSTFVMGAPRREPGRRSNEREREVMLEKPFYLSKKPVTNKEFRRFRKDHDSGAFGELSLNGDDQPVVNVSWEDAVRFLNWLSLQEGLPPFYRESGNTFVPVRQDGQGYRLPTEAEWAYGARAAGQTKNERYPWHGSFPPREVSGNYADESARTLLPTIISGYNDGFPVTSPVGSFPPNEAGFYDMGGNVSEWCHDYYTAYTGSTVQAVNPMGPESGTHRVIRGSSWRDNSVAELRLSYRGYHRKGQDYVGFRIARYP